MKTPIVGDIIYMDFNQKLSFMIVQILTRQGSFSKTLVLENIVLTALTTISNAEFDRKSLELSQPREILDAIIHNALKTLYSSLYNHESVVLVSGLDQHTGTVLTEVIAKMLTVNGSDFSVVCTRPFRFEGEKKRYQRVNETVEKINIGTKLHLIDLERVLQIHGYMTLKKAFEIADKWVLNYISAFLNL